MEYLKWLEENLHINGVIVIIVIAAGYFQNIYTKLWKITADGKTNSALKTLIISGFVVTIMLLLKGANKAEIWDAFLSYFVATSFYELILRPVSKIFKKTDEGK